jgi:hypothetical protein
LPDLTIEVYLLIILGAFHLIWGRSTMTGRFFNRGIRVLAAAGLLLAVTSSPIQPTKSFHSASSATCLPRHFGILKLRHIGEFATWTRPFPKEADSLREGASLQSDIEDELDADIEDELTGISLPSSGSFDVLPSPAPVVHSARVSFAVAHTARPLRC